MALCLKMSCYCKGSGNYKIMVYFSFSDYELTASYHNAASHGGAIKANLAVRITYYNTYTDAYPIYDIEKLEVAE